MYEKLDNNQSLKRVLSYVKMHVSKNSNINKKLEKDEILKSRQMLKKSIKRVYNSYKNFEVTSIELQII